jgi:hypothetical protein
MSSVNKEWPTATFVISQDIADKLVAGYVAERHGFNAEQHVISVEHRPDTPTLSFVHVRLRT